MSTPATNVPPPRKDETLHGILGVLLGVLAVALVLIFTAVYVGGRYLARNLNVSVRERGQEKSIEIRTPGGEVDIRASKEGSPERLGLPLYPGAERQKEGASLSIEAGGEGGSVMVQKYQTPDPLERVVEWYGKQLGPEFIRERGQAGVSIAGHKYEGVVFQSEREQRHRIVAIGRKGNLTEIALVLVKEREPQ